MSGYGGGQGHRGGGGAQDRDRRGGYSRGRGEYGGRGGRSGQGRGGGYGGGGGGGRRGGGGGRGGGGPAPRYSASQQWAVTSAASGPARVQTIIDMMVETSLTPPGDVEVRPPRPGYGKVGRPIRVMTNWYQVDYKSGGIGELYHYDVAVSKVAPPPEKEKDSDRGGETERRLARKPRDGPLPASLCRAAMATTAQKLQWPAGVWAFDGRANLYSPLDKLGGESGRLEQNVMVQLPGEPKPSYFAVKVERVSILPLKLITDFLSGKEDPSGHHHVLQALDVAFKHKMGMMSCSRPDIAALGRSFLRYDPVSTPRHGLGGGAQLWLGYKQALRPCQTGLALTLDTAAGAFWDAGDPRPEAVGRPLSELMYDILSGRARVEGRALSSQSIRKLNAEIKGMKILAVHNGFKRTVAGLSRGSPFEERFALESGQETTVAAYFQSQYGKTVKDRTLPCIRVGNGKALLPAELCEVLPKQKVRKFTGDQTAAMIKITAQRPGDKFKEIQDRSQQVARDASAELKKFGLSLAGKSMTVDARVLPPPTLSYGGKDASFNPSDKGSWNLKGVKFAEPKILSSWAVVCFCSRQNEQQGLQQFVPEFVRGLVACGIQCSATSPPIVIADNKKAVDEILGSAAEQGRQKFKVVPQVLLCVLPDTGAELYRSIKQIGDSYLGIATQCIVASKAKIGQEPRGQMQYIANVALKINAKLGGSNVCLSPITVRTLPSQAFSDMMSRPFMLFGADVTHPGPGSAAPSLAAVVGSLDATATRYAARLSVQPTKPAGKQQVQEIILDFKNMAKDLLLEFYRSTRKRPERIFVFRDGVSEGQFDQVLAHEYMALRKACSEMGDTSSGYAPPITFVVVQKRHQTRLFAADPSTADRSGNLPPGVVVDRGIVHPTEFDFYLNAHAGLQGTNRCVHYHVLADQNGIGADGMQQFCYWLSYLFCRCTRSIAVAAPSQYAHLAAFRGRSLMRGDVSDVSETESMVSGQSGGGSRLPEMLQVHDKLSSTMFYV